MLPMHVTLKAGVIINGFSNQMNVSLVPQNLLKFGSISEKYVWEVLQKH